MGVVYDVMVDLRPDSTTYKQWFGIKLSARGHRMVYIPQGFAHGYLSLTDNSMVYYLVSEFYNKEYERTIRWDDPIIGIEWIKMDKYFISPKDRCAENI
jgi:dTDP-4-dehydrorhamnose 3,5-epimerase